MKGLGNIFHFVKTPVLGADHVGVATPLLKLTLILPTALAALCIGGGIVAIVRNSLALSETHILGMTVTTGHVGVAFVALGSIALIGRIRAVTRNIRDLATLPSDKQSGS